MLSTKDRLLQSVFFLLYLRLIIFTAMTSDTFIKYLHFIESECESHKRDEQITEDELMRLKTEIERFKDRVQTSSLNDQWKHEIAQLQFGYTRQRINRQYLLTFLSFITLGIYAYFVHNQMQKQRLEALDEIQSEMRRIRMVTAM